MYLQPSFLTVNLLFCYYTAIFWQILALSHAGPTPQVERTGVTCDPPPLTTSPEPFVADCYYLASAIQKESRNPLAAHTFTTKAHQFKWDTVPKTWTIRTCSATLSMEIGYSEIEVWAKLSYKVAEITHFCLADRLIGNRYGGRAVLGIDRRMLMQVYPTRIIPSVDAGFGNGTNRTLTVI